jgi:hypothetical protein
MDFPYDALPITVAVITAMGRIERRVRITALGQTIGISSTPGVRFIIANGAYVGAIVDESMKAASFRTFKF